LAEQVFISYRREGGEIMAQLLHDRLIQKGFSVFYDIESLRSGPFNEKLYKEIEECTDFVLVLPNGALDRCIYKEDWVRKEIAHALKCKKNIIPVMLRGFSFPSHLPDEIDAVRWQNGVSIETMEFFNSKVDKIVDMFQSDRSDCDEELNFDEEFDAEFEGLKDLPEVQRGAEDKLSVRMKKRYVERLNQSNNVSPDNPFPEKAGTYFSLVCSQEEKCMVFAEKYIANTDKNILECYLEQLPQSSEKQDDGTCVHTFFIEWPANFCITMDVALVVINWLPSHHSLIINNAVLSKADNRVLICKDPRIFYTHNLFSAEDISHHIGFNCATVSGEYSFEEKNLTANLDGRSLIIDLGKWCVIKRQATYNSSQNVWNTTIKLIPHAAYFAIQLAAEQTPQLTPELIGIGYWFGIFGLKQDVFRAIEVFESSHSPQALYWLAQLFHNDDILGDNEDYIFYLELAAQAGHEDAILHFSNMLIDGKDIAQDYTRAKGLLEELVSSHPTNATALNNLGWMYKNGFGCTKDLKLAKEYFIKATENGGTTAYKHLAEIALLAKGLVIDLDEGLKYLLIAEHFGVNGLEKSFSSFKEFWSDPAAFDKAVCAYREQISDSKFPPVSKSADICLIGDQVHLIGTGFKFIP